MFLRPQAEFEPDPRLEFTTAATKSGVLINLCGGNLSQARHRRPRVKPGDSSWPNLAGLLTPIES